MVLRFAVCLWVAILGLFGGSEFLLVVASDCWFVLVWVWDFVVCCYYSLRWGFALRSFCFGLGLD